MDMDHTQSTYLLVDSKTHIINKARCWHPQLTWCRFPTFDWRHWKWHLIKTSSTSEILEQSPSEPLMSIRSKSINPTRHFVWMGDFITCVVNGDYEFIIVEHVNNPINYRKKWAYNYKETITINNNLNQVMHAIRDGFLLKKSHLDFGRFILGNKA